MQFVAAPLIDSLLGKFIKLDGRSLDTSGGKVRLSRVELRQDAFDDLGLPFALRGGVIEEVEVDIPWTKLKTASVVIRLHQPVLCRATRVAMAGAPAAGGGGGAKRGAASERAPPPLSLPLRLPRSLSRAPPPSVAVSAWLRARAGS